MRAHGPCLLFAAAAFLTVDAARAKAQAPAPPAPPAPPAEQAYPAPAYAPVAPAAPAAPMVVEGGPTDHDLIVGRWGIEARELGVFQRSQGNDPSCGTDCPLHFNAFSVRHWRTPVYAWSAGLTLGFGGGSRYDAGMTKNWDTYFGIGPTVGASFLLTNWKHLAVNFSPGIDFVFFMPRGSGSKTVLINARGLVEGELHMGFIGLPQLSLGLTSGLVIGFRGVTDPANKTSNPSGLATQWDIGFAGPQSLWGLVTNMFLRFYL